MSHALAESVDNRQGQATFNTANLRPSKTGLPFIVFISQRGGAHDDVRVKVSPAPKVPPDQMSSYAVRPFRRESGPALLPKDEILLQTWLDQNENVLVKYWNGDIEHTEDVLEQLTYLGA